MELAWTKPDARQRESARREELFSAWIDQYATDVLRFCCMYLGSRADGEDAAQETFLKVWKKIGSFEGRNHCSPKSWILAVALNTCKDMARSSWRRHEIRVSDPEGALGVSPITEEHREVMMDVMRLPDPYKAVILMVYLHNMTVRETAASLRISPATVSRRLKKAHSLLAYR